MKRVVVIGGGISGLLCSYVFNGYADVTVLEPGTLGGEFLAGGLKYIHHTDAMIDLFYDLDVLYSDYLVQGGILLRGKVHPYPKCFKKDYEHRIHIEEAKRIQYDHYWKTRRTQPGGQQATAMNDPASTKPRKALRCDVVELVEKLVDHATVVKAEAQSVEASVVITDQGEIDYDYLVFAIPLWVVKKIVKFYVPDGHAMRLNVAIVEPMCDKYPKWDYVYTPYTPANYVHRFSPVDSSYSLEMNGEFDKSRLDSDCQFIFSQGYYIKKVTTNLKGHLLPLKHAPAWPDNMAPLGRFAQWDPRATADVVLIEAERLMQKWGLINA